MRWLNVVISLVLVGVAGYPAQSQTKGAVPANVKFELTSPAFTSGSEIPRQYTCEGPDESPELKWSDPPAGTVAFAVVMHDPAAPVGDWTHWVIWNIPSSSHGLAANIPREEQLADGTRQGRNSFANIGYNGPCPPPGNPHHYFFRVYALNRKLDLPAGATRGYFSSVLKGHVLAEEEYMGTYRR